MPESGRKAEKFIQNMPESGRKTEKFLQNLPESGRKTVCVLDASTYAGLWIVKGLLLRGYAVHAALQNYGAGDSEIAIRKLTEIGRDKEGLLKIFAADVLDYHSIVRALHGCSGLFYAFDQARNAAGYHEDMVEIEVRGAHNVVEACAQSPAMEKVVFTSSVAAAVWRWHPNPTDDALLDETFWSDEDFCRKFKLWYALAKTLSEKTAWALAMDRGVNMVAINAALTTGPGFSHQNPGSTISYLKGAAQMYEDGVLATVDVRFLATIHICAFEDPLAYGRYICFNQIVNNAESSINLAQSLRPLLSLPNKCDDSRVYPQRLSNKKLDRLKVHIGCNCTVISSDTL